MTHIIHPIPTLKDNYVWTIIDAFHRCALVVDPGEALPVMNYLKQHQLVLQGVFITHHHWDHTNGLSELIKHYPAPVFSSIHSLIPNVTHRLTEHDLVQLDAFPSFQIIDIPGHTLDGIAFYAPSILFCGDTLFSAGCGRVFEGTAEQLYASLNKISALPDETKIYCAHEYTLNNLRFSQHVEPDNLAVTKHIHAAMTLRQNHEPTLPSTLKLEKEINPFLRCHVPSVIKPVESHVGHPLPQPGDIFQALRRWKDVF